MSIRFDAAGDFLSRTASIPSSYPGPFTMMAWVQFVVDLGAAGSVLYIGADATGFELLGIGTTGACILRDFSGGSVDSGTTFVTGTWYHIALVRGGGVLTAYIDATADATTLTAFSDVPSSPALRFGERPNGERYNGRIEALKIWTGSLTQTQVDAERFRYDPVLATNLWGWWKLTDTSDITDRSGNSRDLTANGSLTTEASPPGLTDGSGGSPFIPYQRWSGRGPVVENWPSPGAYAG